MSAGGCLPETACPAACLKAGSGSFPMADHKEKRMASDSIPVTANGNGTKPCPCGCAPCDEPCCRLDCLERPRFFCGQLLTDQDLMALLGWTQDKLRLGRFRHGWGVVCGLEVHCYAQKPGWVLVKPGYAISCCGDDIIVC